MGLSRLASGAVPVETKYGDYELAQNDEREDEQIQGSFAALRMSASEET
jgi:hypothetical protein